MGNYKDENEELNQLAEEFLDEAVQKLGEGKLKLAEESIKRAKDIYERTDNRRMISRSLNLLSIVYDEMGNESLDMDCLLEAMDVALDAGCYDYAAKCYNNLGSRYMNAMAYDRALELFKLSEETFIKAKENGLCTEEENTEFLLILNLNLAAIYSYTGNLDNSRKYYERAKHLSTHPSITDLYFTFQAFEGLLLWKIGEKEQARSLVDAIIDSARKTEYAQDYLELMDYLIKLLKEMNDFERWESVIKIMETRLTEDGGLNYRMKLHQHWVDFYETTGNDEAYKMACIKYYHLSQEKVAQDYKLLADTFDLKIEMNKAAKEKKVTDSRIYVDSLTRIGNRNKMLEDSKKLIEDSINSKISISIGLIDIDYFKECNDTYGHIKGDECLKAVAKAISESIGDKGSVYRYGGDEFLILIPGIAVSEITNIGIKIKERMNELKIPNTKSPISSIITLSQGYTQAFADEGDSIETLVNLADQVLYSVKRCGRNNYKYTHIDDIKGGIL